MSLTRLVRGGVQESRWKVPAVKDIIKNKMDGEWIGSGLPFWVDFGQDAIVGN